MSSQHQAEPRPTNQNNAIVVYSSTSTGNVNNVIATTDVSRMDISTSPCASDISATSDDVSFALAAAEPALDHARAQILAVISTHTDALDKLAAGYWREMVGCKSAIDIQVMEHLKAVDTWQEKEEGYKSRVSALERRVKELEVSLAEKESILRAVSEWAVGGPGGSGEMTPIRSKETSPDN